MSNFNFKTLILDAEHAYKANKAKQHGMTINKAVKLETKC